MRAPLPAAGYSDGTISYADGNHHFKPPADFWRWGPVGGERRSSRAGSGRDALVRQAPGAADADPSAEGRRWMRTHAS